VIKSPPNALRTRGDYWPSEGGQEVDYESSCSYSGGGAQFAQGGYQTDEFSGGRHAAEIGDSGKGAYDARVSTQYTPYLPSWNARTPEQSAVIPFVSTGGGECRRICIGSGDATEYLDPSGEIVTGMLVEGTRARLKCQYGFVPGTNGEPLESSFGPEVGLLKEFTKNLYVGISRQFLIKNCMHF
jgi:hypothetical protein